jgi:CubicO group peptidase (beta-lactamase class C family)
MELTAKSSERRPRGPLCYACNPRSVWRRDCNEEIATRHRTTCDMVAASLAIALAILFAPGAARGADDYFPPPDSEGGWRTLKDSAQIRKVAGMDLTKLDYAFEYASRTSQHGGLLVVRHGYLVYEKYYGKGNRMATPVVASCAKAFTSIACGIMLEEYKNKFPEGLDTKVFTQGYLPEALPLDDPRKAEIRLGQLLSMAAGLHGEGGNPGFVNGVPSVKLEPLGGRGGGGGRGQARPFDPNQQDQSALHTPLWTNPGDGYSYTSQSPHIASIVLRHVTGMEMQEYIDKKLAQPEGWGQWGWGVYRGENKIHTPGGADIALHATDFLRFEYCILHNGRWGKQQLIPAAYVEACGKPSPYQKHAPMSLMWEVNADGHVAGAPKDAFFKSGGGGFGVVVIPSLDMVIYKMAGSDRQYDPTLTHIPQDYKYYDGSRDHWEPAPKSQFNDGSIGTDDGLRRTIEMVVAAVLQ